MPYLQSVATIPILTWDEAKRRADLYKHGIDFVDPERVFRGFTLTAEETREAYGERKFLTLGLLEELIVSIAHTERGEDIRIVSIRKATKHEARSHFSQIVD